MNNCSKKGIFIVATSNRPDKIDPAVLRTGRIDKNVYVPLPDREARREMFSLYLAKRPVEEGINLDLLADKTEGYIASDIAFIVNDAAMTAAYTRVKISQQLLESSLSNIRPSLRSEVMASYTQIKDRMEDKNRTNNARAIVNGL
jgi:transitional endoplasmic reticulum ATPase